MDVNVNKKSHISAKEFCSETLFISPCASPFPSGKLQLPLDLMQINGRFTPIGPLSNTSTRSSSLCSSPILVHPETNPEARKCRRNETESAVEENFRRHSFSNLEQTTDSERTPQEFTWSPIPGPGHDKFIYKIKENDIFPSENFDENVEKTSQRKRCTIGEIKTKGNLYPNCDANVWLRSCEEEIVEPIDGEVKGNIPKWLNGSLLRNGPGSIKVGTMTFNHLFDSSALLHRFCIKDGRVTYQCRFLQTNTYKKNTAANRIVVTEFGTSAVPDPCHSIFDRVSTMFKAGEGSSDNAMISIYPFGDEYFAFTESPIIHKFDVETLETEKRLNVSDHVGIVHHTSHPHVMSDGTVYNLGMSVTKTGPCYNIIYFPHGDRMFEDAHIVASVPARWKLNPGYQHTFGITENYFIIVEQPLSISVAAMIKSQLKNQPMLACFKWFPESQTHIYLLDRESGNLKHTFHAEAFFYLHIINQYEKDNHVVLDICCYRDPAMLNCMYVESMKNMQSNENYAKMFRGRPLRFVLPIRASRKKGMTSSDSLFSISNIFCKSNNKSHTEYKNNGDKEKSNIILENLVHLDGTKATAYKMPNKSIFCKPELLCDLGCETPRFYYEEHLGREYQYFYAISSDVDGQNPGTLIKVDVINKTRLTWCEENCYPSEPIFVPSPEPQTEDDGVILASMVWGHNEENRVGLLVLSAKTFTELGRCEFNTPGPVPKCLHGWFAASTSETDFNE